MYFRGFWGIFSHNDVIVSKSSSVAQSCPTLWGPMDCSTPGFPVHHQILEFTQIHVHQDSDVIQPFYPLSSLLLLAFTLSLHDALPILGGEGDDTGWDGWMASMTWWTWVWASSGSWWWTGKPGVLQSMGPQRVGHNWVTELNWKFVPKYNNFPTMYGYIM